MRVITGSARGRRLATLPGEEITRPTSESVKEALFSIIQFEIEGKKVLDLFAGSGQLGIEALSRGAASCTFVEKNAGALKIVEQNVEHCLFSESSCIVLSDALAFLSRKNNFDIAFVDPPYNGGLIDKVLPLLVRNMNPGGVIICETLKNEELMQSVSGWGICKQRSYGKTKLTLYRKEQ